MQLFMTEHPFSLIEITEDSPTIFFWMEVMTLQMSWEKYTF